MRGRITFSFAFFALPLCVCSLQVILKPTSNVVIEGRKAKFLSSIQMDYDSNIYQTEWIVNNVASSSSSWNNYMAEHKIEITPGTGEYNSTLSIEGKLEMNKTVVERAVIELIGVTDSEYHKRSGRLLIQGKPSSVYLKCFSNLSQYIINCKWTSPYTLLSISHYNVNITNETMSNWITTEANEFNHTVTEGGMYSVSVAAVVEDSEGFVLEGEIDTVSLTVNLTVPEDDSALISTSTLLAETITSGTHSTSGTSSTSGAVRYEPTTMSERSTSTLSVNFWIVVAVSGTIILLLTFIILMTLLLLARKINSRKRITASTDNIKISVM